MTENPADFTSSIFILTTLATLFLFIWAIKKSSIGSIRKKATPIFIGLILWLTLQSVLALKNVYSSDTNSFPPKIVLAGILPTIGVIVFLFSTTSGRQFIDNLPIKNLTYLNIVRVPVEVVLYWLFLSKSIPELMTFSGRNFDILAGISAPFIAYFGLTKKKLSSKVILAWNLICLGLLLNIVVIALLSAPSPVQRFAFDQPNVAILYFPYSWLPTFIVPIVLFGHLVSIKKLTYKSG